eukprot:8774159-Alexandrium_andersonii.AAC.2
MQQHTAHFRFTGILVPGGTFASRGVRASRIVQHGRPASRLLRTCGFEGHSAAAWYMASTRWPPPSTVHANTIV